MENQQEIGGAQALLLLGTKDSKSDDHDHNSDHDHMDSVHENGQHDVSGILEEKENQQLNDAVEAAVMRYVGGTLDDNDHTIHNGQDQDNDNDDVGDSGGHGAAGGDGLAHLGQKRRLNHDDIISNMHEYQWDRFLEEDVAADFDRTPPKRKRRKSYGAGNDIDPELAGLDTTSEHDQLVHAAILGAGELAKQLSIPAKSHLGLGGNRNRNASESEPNAISQLAHAASALSGGLKGAQTVKHRRPLKKSADVHEPHILPRSKYDLSSLESLIEQAASEACIWYNTHAESGLGGPRPFSQDEILIVESFVDGYCRINNLTRADICRRVWSSERTKDNFWESLTKVLPYRSRASVYKHVRRQYHVFDIRARWTPEEDEMLRKLAATCKTNWKKVGEVMNRMPEDCRDRWRNYVKCGENRAMNKWSEEEETTLRDIVMDMLTNETASMKDKPILINWTLVSERMNGLRSRIQCRYKWNKLLRRELLSRVAMMDTETKLWLFNRVLEANFADIDSIDWDYILHLYHEENKDKSKVLWTASDFKIGFEKMKSLIRDNKNLPLHNLLTKLIASLYEQSPPVAATKEDEKPMPSYDLEPKPLERPTVDEEEAASVANAAVSAVASGATEQESQHQEYSLWR